MRRTCVRLIPETILQRLLQRQCESGDVEIEPGCPHATGPPAAAGGRQQRRQCTGEQYESGGEQDPRSPARTGGSRLLHGDKSWLSRLERSHTQPAEGVGAALCDADPGKRMNGLAVRRVYWVSVPRLGLPLNRLRGRRGSRGRRRCRIRLRWRLRLGLRRRARGAVIRRWWWRGRGRCTGAVASSGRRRRRRVGSHRRRCGQQSDRDDHCKCCSALHHPYR
jgi:hypothetical protein